MGVWWAWKWRCDNVFGNNGKCRDRTKFVKEKAKEVTMASLKIKESNPRGSRVEVMVGWTAPQTGWFKLNTDGASRGNLGLATAGRVLRDEFGSWCGGFALNIGSCTEPLAEEANRLADGLANYAFSLPIGFHSCIVVPDVGDSLLSDDVIGSVRPRRVRS
ncbi:hypothetical protein ISN44_As06g035090 [Arabidopsis suecica]|uniref:RNase H type-1 domain-containing protein n=1 Tax=Arabidopsis suecica TaxID=45249 RepID=A0A8T2CR06_ARASU|nr:hypothetical protein ISN44_As06g035090 [Arabidopsis suecica]